MAPDGCTGGVGPARYLTLERLAGAITYDRFQFTNIGSVSMEFTSPTYELLYIYESLGTRFPPYIDLMRERDILAMISERVGERSGGRHN